MKLSRFSPLTIQLLAVTLLLQSCASATPADKQSAPDKPLFTIKIDRNKNLPQSNGADASLDKFLPDEIEKPDLTHDRFDQLLSTAMLKVQPGHTLLGIKDHAISFKSPSGEKFDSFTDTSWAACKDIPGQRKAYLRTTLATLRDLNKKGWKSTNANDVLPIIRSSELITETSKLQAPGGKPINLAWYPLAPGIVCIYAHDTPNNLAMVNAEDAAKFKLTAQDIKKGPLKTLRSHLPVDVSVYGANGIFLVSCGGDFESSLILDDQIMNTIKQHVKGRLVFGVSAKDVLLLCGDADQHSVDVLRKTVIHSANNAPRAVSDKLYYWDDGKISIGP